MKITLSIEHGSRIYEDVQYISDEDFSRYRYPTDFLIIDVELMTRKIAKELESGPRNDN